MKMFLLLSTLLLASVVVVPSSVRAEQQPEMIVEKMAVKLVRGVTNVLTGIVELPKQTVLTVEDMGATGYLIGPIKGVGMTLYRSFIGVAETLFFLVPQPGYYDPMINPPYVWDGWESKRDTSRVLAEEK